MKTAKKLLLMWVAIVVCVSAAFAGPPLDGKYLSPGLGADLIVGRHSESWSVPLGFLTLDNAIDAASFDGATLGTQWSYSCPTVIDVFVFHDTRDASGTGVVNAFITYDTGGSFWLAGAGPWANGDPDYPGVIDVFRITVAESWINNVRTGTSETILMSGHFIGDHYPCFQWQANGAEVSSTDTGAKPADYPAFLAGVTCLATPTLGNWSTQDDITFDIGIGDCVVSTHDKTWGAIKDLYKN